LVLSYLPFLGHPSECFIYLPVNSRYAAHRHFLDFTTSEFLVTRINHEAPRYVFVLNCPLISSNLGPNILLITCNLRCMNKVQNFLTRWVYCDLFKENNIQRISLVTQSGSQRHVIGPYLGPFEPHRTSRKST
jgi:hypothetical protein